MAKGKKKKAKPSGAHGGGLGGPGVGGKGGPLKEIVSAKAEGDNRRALALARLVLNDMDAAPEAKQAALFLKRRLSYDPIALAFAGGGVILWVVLLMVFVLNRG